MSADNYYVIRRHPEGGFAAVMGFASDDSDEAPQVDPVRHHPFPTIKAASEFAHAEYSEYGVSIHPECGMVAIDSEQLEAMMRLLIDSGDMTPMARLQIRKLFDYEAPGV